MIKAVVFDLDGTLVDSVDAWAEIWHESFKLNGIEASKSEIKRFIGLPLKSILEELGISKEMEENIRKASKSVIEKYVNVIQAFPDSLPILKFLSQKKIKIGVASSSEDEWIRIVLERLGMLKYVNSYVSGYDVKRPKPYPDVFIEIFKRLNEDPINGIVVGDRESDTLPAMEISAKGILIDRNGDYKGDPKADHVIKSLYELKRWFE
ncbi:MAG: HAD family hydrolase [Candidatus Micrarchaeia archaeon]|jgi:HAD superfamily hydrolase (TIGR01549 family)